MANSKKLSRGIVMMIEGITELADDTPEWLDAWNAIGRYAHHRLRERRRYLEQLAARLAWVAEVKAHA